MILEIQALENINFKIFGKQNRRETYNKPTAKMTVMPHFFLVDICNDQMQPMGKISTAKSKIMLNPAETMMPAGIFIQWPGVEGIQIFFRGVHVKTVYQKHAK
jgi:hypothetical protein